MNTIIDIILHTDDALIELIQDYGIWVYLILFVVIFSETGLVIFPFLPGDGLLFSVGVVSTSGALRIDWLILILILAAILGNTTNYFIGRFAGRRFLEIKNRTFQKYINETDVFFRKHGGKAILLSRFLPILRTYIPFLAGVGHWNFKKFQFYTTLGAVLWVCSFTLAGYIFGEIPWVQQNYGLIFLGLIIVTLIPFLIQILKTIFLQKRVVF